MYDLMTFASSHTLVSGVGMYPFFQLSFNSSCTSFLAVHGEAQFLRLNVTYDLLLNE